MSTTVTARVRELASGRRRTNDVIDAAAIASPWRAIRTPEGSIWIPDDVASSLF